MFVVAILFQSEYRCVRVCVDDGYGIFCYRISQAYLFGHILGLMDMNYMEFSY